MSFALKGHLAKVKSIEIRHLIQWISLENLTCGLPVALETICKNLSSVFIRIMSQYSALKKLNFLSFIK